jgi:ABC-type nitrate/sulfonate/bicarbonate transport system substrate-binding protein
VGLLAGCLGNDGGGDGGDSGDGTSGGGSGGGRSLTIGYQPFYAEAWSALVIRHGELAEKYLPEGYSVDGWQVALQGSVVGQRMISGDNQVGYTGDMPTITAVANNDTPISAVGLAGFSNGQQCNLGVVPADSGISEPQGLDGKEWGVTTGACTHRFMLRMADQEDLEFNISDQGINTILSGIRSGDLAVGFGWEPTMNRVVEQAGDGNYLLTGAPYDVPDAAGIIMPDSLINDDPEAAKAWMKAELEAKHIMRTDPERAIDLIAEEGELSEYDRSVLEDSIYTSLDLNPDVKRLEFVTNYGEVEPAATLLQQNGPEYLVEQGFIDRIPDEDRYKLGPLEDATSELSEEVEWTPADGRSGNATGGGANATDGSGANASVTSMEGTATTGGNINTNTSG